MRGLQLITVLILGLSEPSLAQSGFFEEAKSFVSNIFDSKDGVAKEERQALREERRALRRERGGSEVSKAINKTLTSVGLKKTKTIEEVNLAQEKGETKSKTFLNEKLNIGGTKIERQAKREERGGSTISRLFIKVQGWLGIEKNESLKKDSEEVRGEASKSDSENSNILAMREDRKNAPTSEDSRSEYRSEGLREGQSDLGLNEVGLKPASQENDTRSQDIVNLRSNGFFISDEQFENDLVSSFRLIKDENSNFGCSYSIKSYNDVNVPNSDGGGQKSYKIFSYDAALAKIIPRFMKDLNQDCIEEFVRGYIEYKESKVDQSNLCASSFCQDAIDVYYSNITDAIQTGFSRSQADAFLSSSQFKNFAASSGLESVFSEMEEVAACREFDTGETRYPRNKYSSYQRHSHALTKLGANTYEAKLAIKLEHSSTDLKNTIFSRIKECIDISNDYLTTEFGEKLKIKIISEDENAAMPKKQQLPLQLISIKEIGAHQAETARNTSFEFNTYISCPSITHEVLHHLGLVDEYEENPSNPSDDYKVFFDRSTDEAFLGSRMGNRDKSKYQSQPAYNDCRPKTVEYSIMKNHKYLYPSIVKRKKLCKVEHPVMDFILQERSNQMIASHSMVNTINVRKFCSSMGAQSERVDLGADYRFDGLFYEDVNFQGNSLTFTSKRIEDYKGVIQLVKRPYSCQCENEECRSVLATFYDQYLSPNKPFVSGTSCPAGTMEIQQKLENDYAKKDEPTFKWLSERNFAITSSSKEGGLLLPGHFDRVVWGACYAKSKRYHQCAKHSYDLIDFKCPERPQACDDPSSWLFR